MGKHRHNNKEGGGGGSKGGKGGGETLSSTGLSSVKATIEGELVALEFVDKPSMTLMLGRLSAFSEGQGKGKSKYHVESLWCLSPSKLNLSCVLTYVVSTTYIIIINC